MKLRGFLDEVVRKIGLAKVFQIEHRAFSLSPFPGEGCSLFRSRRAARVPSGDRFPGRHTLEKYLIFSVWHHLKWSSPAPLASRGARSDQSPSFSTFLPARLSIECSSLRKSILLNCRHELGLELLERKLDFFFFMSAGSAAHGFVREEEPRLGTLNPTKPNQHM